MTFPLFWYFSCWRKYDNIHKQYIYSKIKMNDFLAWCYTQSYVYNDQSIVINMYPQFCNFQPFTFLST